MAKQEKDIIRTYFSVSRALQDSGNTNSKGLSQRELEYMLAIANYQEVRFTEKQLSGVFNDPVSTVSESIKALTNAGVLKKEPTSSGNLRGARIILTKSGKQAYRTLREGLAKAVEEDYIGKRKPIF